MIYLDNAATTKPCLSSVKALNAALLDFGNPSSLHSLGVQAEHIIEEAKDTIANSLFCDNSEILFTSSATESNNLAIFGSFNALKRRGNKIVTTSVEHPSVSEPIKKLSEMGGVVIYIEPKDGVITPQMIANAVDLDTILVSCMWVNNETGMVIDIIKTAALIKAKNPKTLFHVDAVQGYLKLPLKLKGSQIDLLTISGHKVYAPKGIGALYVKKGVRILPILLGGGQQKGLRAGTEPVPMIAAFGGAVTEYYPKVSINYNKVLKLREYFNTLIMNTNCSVNYDGIPHIISLNVPFIRSEILLHYLEEKGIYVSSGSACARGKKSSVLAAMGYYDNSDTTIRISLGDFNTLSEIDTLVQSLIEAKIWSDNNNYKK